jgi:hypothetical protein
MSKEKRNVTYILKLCTRVRHYYIADIIHIIITASFILHINLLLFIAYHNMKFDDDDKVDKTNFKFHFRCVHMH